MSIEPPWKEVAQCPVRLNIQKWPVNCLSTTSGRTVCLQGNSRCEGREWTMISSSARHRGSLRDRPVKRSRATKWSFYRERGNRGRRASRRSVTCSPCFISVSLGTLCEARTPPRRCPCSRWALEHGTTRRCRNFIPRRRSRQHPHRRTHSKRRTCRGSISRQRTWLPPGGEAVPGYSRRNPLAGDVAEAWARGAICPGPPSRWTRGRLLTEGVGLCRVRVHGMMATFNFITLLLRMLFIIHSYY